MLKRMCARIVSNMSKLVEEPIEAAPLKDLIPALGDAIKCPRSRLNHDINTQLSEDQILCLVF